MDRPRIEEATSHALQGDRGFHADRGISAQSSAVRQLGSSVVPVRHDASMPTLTLSAIEAAVRSSWGPDTTFVSADYMARGSGQPSRGQCGTTALVLQELLGGDLMVADVEHEGRVDGVHYWNVTAGGLELDLTRDQFTDTESLINVRRVTTRCNPGGAGEQPFQLLQDRVAAALHSETSTPS